MRLSVKLSVFDNCTSLEAASVLPCFFHLRETTRIYLLCVRVSRGAAAATSGMLPSQTPHRLWASDRASGTTHSPQVNVDALLVTHIITQTKQITWEQKENLPSAKVHRTFLCRSSSFACRSDNSRCDDNLDRTECNDTEEIFSRHTETVYALHDYARVSEWSTSFLIQVCTELTTRRQKKKKKNSSENFTLNEPEL